MQLGLVLDPEVSIRCQVSGVQSLKKTKNDFSVSIAWSDYCDQLGQATTVRIADHLRGLVRIDGEWQSEQNLKLLPRRDRPLTGRSSEIPTTVAKRHGVAIPYCMRE